MDLRNKMYEHLQNLPYQFHNDADTGDLIQRSTTDIDTIYPNIVGIDLGIPNKCMT